MSTDKHKMKKKQLHIAMFPWLAFGHMIPYLELANLIARKDHNVSFISSSRNIDRLTKIPSEISPLINFVRLSLPYVSGLPLDAEATSDVPYKVIPYLKEAYDGLRGLLFEFLEASKPDWLVFDFAAYWAPDVAHELRIPCAYFTISIPASLSFGPPTSDLVDARDDRTTPQCYTRPPAWIPFPTTVCFKLYEVLKVFSEIVPEEAHVSTLYRFDQTLRGCDILAIRGCTEFDSKWLDLLTHLHGKPVLPVGQLPTTVHDGDDADTWRWIKEWLDGQKERSVVYVGFGSETKPSQEELTEIALGLELSELPFFWALKTRCGESDTETVALPEGFEERTEGRGVVVTSWVPQLKILSHDSVGAILSHSGWSSVVEALSNGKALVLLPFLADQGLNARVLEEERIGYPIPRNESDGSFTRNSVAESVRLVVAEEGGKVYRENAKAMRGVFGDRDKQRLYVDSFLDFLQCWMDDNPNPNS